MAGPRGGTPVRRPPAESRIVSPAVRRRPRRAGARFRALARGSGRRPSAGPRGRLTRSLVTPRADVPAALQPAG